jgi:hypothetical protein
MDSFILSPLSNQTLAPAATAAVAEAVREAAKESRMVSPQWKFNPGKLIEVEGAAR